MTGVTLNTGAAILLAALAPACSTARPPATPPRIDSAAPMDQRATPADAGFMRGMMSHHAQALAMAALVPARTTSADVRALAERIVASQRAEIELMSRWLRARGHSVPDVAHVEAGQHDPELHMPGMLTQEELGRLAASRGTIFDREFLSLMIRHHRGALAMVQQLLSRPGGGQDPEAYRFAADTDADQRAEIARMERMLAARGSPDGAR